VILATVYEIITLCDYVPPYRGNCALPRRSVASASCLFMHSRSVRLASALEYKRRSLCFVFVVRSFGVIFSTIYWRDCQPTRTTVCQFWKFCDNICHCFPSYYNKERNRRTNRTRTPITIRGSISTGRGAWGEIDGEVSGGNSLGEFS